MRERRWLKRAISVGVAALAAIAVSVAVSHAQADATETPPKGPADGGAVQMGSGWT